MFQVALLRHPAVSIAPGTCYGRRDVPLQEGWEAWSDTMQERLGTLAPKRIWSSPAARCALVAERLASCLRLPVILDSRLLELDFGAWEGQSWDTVPRAMLDRWAADPIGFRPPGGEHGAALIERVEGFAGTLMEKSQSCIVLSHGGPLRLLLARLRGCIPDLLAAPPGLGALTIVRVQGGSRIADRRSATHRHQAGTP